MNKLALIGAMLLGFNGHLAHHRHHRPPPPAPTAVAAMPPDPVTYMQALAPQWWGAKPCSGDYTVTYASQYPGPLGVDEVALGWAAGCAITLNSQLFGDPVSPAIYDSWLWLDFCRMYLHEYGHLLGLPHSPDPTNVMYETTDDLDTPPECAVDPTGFRYPGDFEGHR